MDFGEKSQVNRIEEQFIEVKFVSTTLSCLFSSGHLLACCGLPSVVHWKYWHIVKNSQNLFKIYKIFIPCLSALELSLPVPVHFCCIFAATKDKFGSFLKKLSQSFTLPTYHHNSSWTIRQARNESCSGLSHNPR